jgi:choline dehydrogenase-like flavoprotein
MFGLRLHHIGARTNCISRPYFNKSETFHPPSEALAKEHDVRHDPRSFGTSGPIQVSYSTDYSPSHALWHRTLNTLGVKTNSTHTTGSNVGVWTNINAVDPRSGARSYSANYSSLLSESSDLRILTWADVTKIVLIQDGGKVRATGVSFTCQGRDYVVNVSREVILSAGSVCSPQILEVSGVGKPQVLERAGVTTVVDSSMVGENLQEHLSKPLPDLVCASKYRIHC